MRTPSLAIALLLNAAIPCLAQAQAAAPVAAASAEAVRPAILEAASQLIQRVLPQQAGRFQLELIPATAEGQDVFEIEAKGDAIVLRGNNGLSLAMAFNWYLRHEAKINFDWQAAQPLQFAGKLPPPQARLRQTCVAKERFFLNYCTYGYTMPWWGWEQWQRFVDWMAMNGINRPLLQCGQEAVWLEVWKSYGMTDEQVRTYFCAPAHLPWHRMANLDKWGGPLPASYIEGQKKLQLQILDRARRLGMKPILGGFAGHVPEALKTVKPDAKITRIAPGWGGMAAQYTTWFLDPTDPLFREIQIRYLKKQTELYGTDHCYGADPFNEITPPSWEPDYLARVSQSIYSGMAEADPQAIWYQMSWTFYYDKNWTPPRLAAMTRAVPTGKMVYLDYVCEESEFFRRSENFYGAPFIWCYLANFGGNTHLVAPINKLSTRLNQAMTVGNCVGVGSTLEGLNVNPIAYDLLLEQPWHADAAVDQKAWIADYAMRRAGRADPAVLNAWKILSDKVFVDNASGIWGHGIVLQAVPHLNDKGGWTNPSFPYKQAALVAAIDELLKAEPASQQADGYQFDLVNLTRQALGNHAATVHARMMRAVEIKDLPAFRREAALFLELGRDLDTLLGSRHEFLLGRWLADARAWAATPAEQAYYEYNARQIITTWHKTGGGLNDYANRQWNGLMASYYLGRWSEFIKRLDAALAEGKPMDSAAYTQWRYRFEDHWLAASGEGFATTPQGNPTEIASRLLAKYRAELVPPPVAVTLAAAAWLPASTPTTGELTWTLDVSARIAKPGTYKVTFKYTTGQSALGIAKVALLQDGQEIAVDAHEGWTGHENRQNTYTLKADKLVPGKPVSLTMAVQAASSTDTAGTIDIQP
jgi:alpha-N-acetylglucosaminidase